MTAKPTISVIIPAYNEDGNVAGTVREVLEALGDRFGGYEILIVNDGSKDRTGEVAEELAAGNPLIKVLHNSPNMGFGYSYRRGVQAATCDYVGFFPGDDCLPAECIAAVFDQVGTADIISHYTSNLEVRLPARRVISRTYTWLMNTLFGLHLSYFNGPTVHRREIIQSVKISTYGFAFLSEIMVRLIRSGHSYRQIGTLIRDRKRGSSKALKLKNVVTVVKTICTLFWDVNVANRKLYRRTGRSVTDEPQGNR
jgi:glycosyltransferase involved in cell wall biosynthesis